MKKNKLNIPSNKLQDNDSVAEQALSKFNAGQYKEAIELYKSLLKQSARIEWQQNLAHCYLRRAFEFAAKGMAKEALVLWENYAQNTKPPYQGFDCYIAWMLQSNNLTKAKSYLSQLSVQQIDEQYPELACLLGLLIMTGKSELQTMLAADSVFLIHTTYALTALSAYRNNDRAGVEQALQQLPFRSAFRDLRTLLKASLLLSESIAQARSLLTKIPVNSPYRLAADLLQVTTDKGVALVNNLLAFNPAQIRLITTAKNLNKKQSELLDSLTKQNNRLSDKLKFNLAIQYQTLFNNKSLYHYCLVVALTRYTTGERDFIKHFGAIDPFERNRLLALSYEGTQENYDAEYYWQQCLTILKNQGAYNNYKIALITRHLADREEHLKKKVAYLIASLDYDADDFETYLAILRCYENGTEHADAFKHWLTKSIEKFPENIEILNLAINASVRNKAFKKATQYALALLKIDPINTAAKQVLFSSHLAHARKLIKTKKFHLVEKEIQQAESIILSKRHQILAAVMRGFYRLVTDNKTLGALQIASAVQQLNEGLFNRHFFVTMEALLLDLPIATALKALPPLAKNYSLSEQDIRQLVQLISEYDNEEHSNRVLLQKALDKFKTIIKQSLKQEPYSEAQLLSLCECFARIQHFELLGFYVKQTAPKYQQAIWKYYRIMAKVKGNPRQCSNIDIYLLQNGWELARSQNDERAAVLISAFIDKYYDALEPASFVNESADEDDSGISKLFCHLPNNIFQKLEKKMDELTSKNRPENMLKIIAEQFLANDMQLMANIIKHDGVLFALLILKAADELDINIGVTANDVINYCNLK